MSLSKKLRRYKGWIAVAVLVVIAGTIYMFMRPAPAEETTTTYETQAVAISTISSTISGTGNLDVYDATEVWPKVSGTVASVKVAEGDLVAAGAVLYTLDSSGAEANTAKAYASYKQAQQGVEQAESQVLKAENSLDDLEERSESPSSTVSTSDIEAAEKEVSVAEASLVAAKASLSSAQLACNNAEADEADYTVKAPADGVVWSLTIEVGDSVSADGGGGATTSSASSGQTSISSDAPLMLAPDDPLAVRLAINEVDIPDMETDQRADVEFDALPGLALTGKVIEVAEEGTNEQGVITYDVWIALDVSDERIKSGMSAAATIVTNVAQDVLVVPNAAIQRDDESAAYVMVLEDSDGEPVSIYVTVGISSATETVIESGVDEGVILVTQIVTSGGEEEEAESGGGGFRLPGMGGGPR